MTEHDNLSQTLFIVGLIKYVQLTLLHCLIVSEFRRYSPLTRTRKVIRDSVQSSAGLLKVHIFRCFQKISLILCNSDIIFRITFIIKGSFTIIDIYESVHSVR